MSVCDDNNWDEDDDFSDEDKFVNCHSVPGLRKRQQFSITVIKNKTKHFMFMCTETVLTQNVY